MIWWTIFSGRTVTVLVNGSSVYEFYYIFKGLLSIHKQDNASKLSFALHLQNEDRNSMKSFCRCSCGYIRLWRYFKSDLSHASSVILLGVNTLLKVEGTRAHCFHVF